MTRRKHDTFLDAIKARPLVIIESPFAGDLVLNTRYLRAAFSNSIARGEAPFASHAVYTKALDDKSTTTRQLGLSLGWSWMTRADLVAVYEDLGVSAGMEAGIEIAKRMHIRIERRTILNWEDDK